MLGIQEKEEMDTVKSRAFTETAVIKEELKSTIVLVKNMDQGHRWPIEYLKSEVKIMKIGMIDTPCLERWSEYMDSAITLVLQLLDEQMKHLEINSGTGGG